MVFEKEDCLLAIKQSESFCQNWSKNIKIRRAAFYLSLKYSKKKVRIYYDNPDYPGWRGGFIETGLKDFRGRTYGIVEKRAWTNSDQAAALRAIRKCLMSNKMGGVR